MYFRLLNEELTSEFIDIEAPISIARDVQDDNGIGYGKKNGQFKGKKDWKKPSAVIEVIFSGKRSYFWKIKKIER